MSVNIVGKQIIAALSYVVIVFPLAYIWHLMLFEADYRAYGYFAGDPKVTIGLASIIIQGIILSLFYAQIRSGGGMSPFRFCLFVGVFFWTCHVLALVAKQDVPNAWGYVAMESLYLLFQFGLFALALKLIYRKN